MITEEESMKTVHIIGLVKRKETTKIGRSWYLCRDILFTGLIAHDGKPFSTLSS